MYVYMYSRTHAYKHMDTEYIYIVYITKCSIFQHAFHMHANNTYSLTRRNMGEVYIYIYIYGVLGSGIYIYIYISKYLCLRVCGCI